MTRDQSPVSWIPVQHIIQAAQVCMELEGDRLRNLLQRSSQYLAPLGDPLLVDFGVHRWLKGQREEAYSDWLAWIVEQINTRERVYRVFGLDPAQSSKNHGPISVKRESPVEEGHEGRPGRLDLMVKFGEQVEIVVEVKVTDADFAATAKNLGYRKSISQEFPEAHFQLLATSGEKEAYDDFKLVTWERVCTTLRSVAGTLCSEGSILIAAMTLAFVGAVEENLLAFPAKKLQDLMRGSPVQVTAAIGSYIEQWLKKDEEAAYGSP